MDNEKLFEFMEKMYSEMQNGFSNVKKDIKDVKKDVVDLKKNVVDLKKDTVDLKSGQLKLEDKLEETRKTLYDGYIQNSQAINRIETKLDDLSDKVDKHDIKIQVIEGGKIAL